MNRTITVKIVTDALAVLSSGSLEGHLYMFDDNRRGGSYGEGTAGMVTVLDFGERSPEEYEILFFVMNLRPDVAVEIMGMRFDSDAVNAESTKYEDTDISCWTVRAVRPFDTVKGMLFLRMAGHRELFVHEFTIKGKDTGNGL